MTTQTMGRIVNTRPTFLTLPAIKGPNPEDPRLPLVIHPALRIGPGATNVPDDYLAALDKLRPVGAGKVWSSWRALGWVKVIRASSPGAQAEVAKREGPDAPPSLMDMREEGALAIVAAEDNLLALRMWFAAEKRKPVKSAIQARMTALSSPGSGSAPPAGSSSEE